MANKPVVTGKPEWTAPAPCRWPFLWRQAKKYDDQGMEWKVTLVLDVYDSEQKAILVHVKALYAQCKEKVGRDGNAEPWKKDLDKEKNPTGKYLLEFKSDYAPLILDGRNKQVTEDPSMGNDTILRVCFKPGWYDAAGRVSVKLYLVGAQIVKLKKYDPLPAVEAVENGYDSAEDAFNALAGDAPEYPDPLPTGQEDEDWLDAPAASDDEAVPTDDEISF